MLLFSDPNIGVSDLKHPPDLSNTLSKNFVKNLFCAILGVFDNSIVTYMTQNVLYRAQFGFCKPQYGCYGPLTPSRPIPHPLLAPLLKTWFGKFWVFFDYPIVPRMAQNVLYRAI